ncbi:MAG: DUF4012 domain-containing protein [Patescibacteria group bacterium]|nr:DUF4012 domain-containing protein [Patescibacteria group bacterium]
MTKKKKVFTGLVIGVVLLSLVSYFLVISPVMNIIKRTQLIISSAQQIKADFSKNDLSLLKHRLEKFFQEYQNLKEAAQSIYWASFIPYVSDLKHGIEAGDYVIMAATEAINAVEPYADLIGFKKGGASFIKKSAEERLQTAILTLDKLTEKIDKIAINIDKAREKVNKINNEKYPEKIFNFEIRKSIKNARETFDGLASLFVDAQPLLKNLAEIFGSKEEKTYLVLYQNDKERRATGGFLTFYAVFKIKDGRISIVKSDDIYALDASISSHSKAPREIATYHKNVPFFYIRDSNLSPDFYQSVKIFESLYQRSNQKIKYDGIIAIDSKVLVDMLTIFGDTYAEGINFSSRIDRRCDCPQVLYTLFDIVGRPVGYIKENRKGILGSLMFALVEKALKSSPSQYWGPFISNLIENLQQKHILVYFVDEEIQKAVEQVNFAGRIKDFDEDYLHINNVNFAGAKSNLFVREIIELRLEGNKRNLIITYRNPYPHSDCNLERGGLCLNATLRNWLRVYVPKGSKLINFRGSLRKVNVYEDLGKTVFEGYLEVPTQGKAIVNVTYELPSAISQKALMIQKQPGVIEQRWIINLNGQKIFDDYLKTDQVLKIN